MNSEKPQVTKPLGQSDFKQSMPESMSDIRNNINIPTKLSS